MLPGLRASMWRVLADPAPGGHGVGISEITFYRALVALLNSEFRRTFGGFLVSLGKGQGGNRSHKYVCFKAGENLEKKNRHFSRCHGSMVGPALWCLGNTIVIAFAVCFLKLGALDPDGPY